MMSRRLNFIVLAESTRSIVGGIKLFSKVVPGTAAVVVVVAGSFWCSALDRSTSTRRGRSGAAH